MTRIHITNDAVTVETDSGDLIDVVAAALFTWRQTAATRPGRGDRPQLGFTVGAADGDPPVVYQQQPPHLERADEPSTDLWTVSGGRGSGCG